MVVTGLKPHFDKVEGLFRFVLISGSCSLGLMVYSIYTGLSLWKVVPGAVTTAKRYLLAVFLYSAFAMFLPALAGLTGDYRERFGAVALLGNLRTIAYVGIWYLYLRRSKRVRATYGA